MKKLLSVWILVAFAVIGPTSAQLALGKEIKGSDGKNIVLPSKVPAEKTYVLFDENGAKMSTFKGGEPVKISTEKKFIDGDCVLIECPSTMSSSTACWHCKKR
jgi:hypothetical protein